MKALLLLATLLAPSLARADWSLDFVRISCIPESRYFFFEHKPVSGPAALTDAQFDDAKRAERMRVWQRHGYFDPHKLTRPCDLPSSSYSLQATQPYASERGMCGGAPLITLSLFRNGEPLVKEVPFGYNCSGGPSVASVEIYDGLEGWDTRNMTVCVTPAPDQPQRCTYLSETYGQITKSAPITAETIDRFARER